MAARGGRRARIADRPRGRTAGRTLRIAASFTPGSAHARYRVVLPLRELERRGHTVLQPGADAGADDAFKTAGADVLFIHHFFEEQILELVERLRGQRIAVVWDKDDDLSHTPKRAPAYKSYGGRRGIKRGFARSIRIASAASLMTTPSEHLADRFRALGVQHVEVLGNYVAPEDVGRERPPHEGIVIGITAGGEHGDDLDRLRIDRVLRRLLEAHADVRVVGIGCDHDLPAERYVHHPQVPVDRLLAVEREIDIGLAPLADSAFNRARSDIKLKEYAAAGAMWLASPVGPYVGMGEAQGGLLVDDDDWYAALDRLVADHRRRTSLMEAACAWARRQTIDRATIQWEAAFTRAVERVRA
jgi:hypothetical protein